MKQALTLVTALLLVTGTALAGTFIGTWPNIGVQKPTVDSVACATQAITRTDQDHSCWEIPSTRRDDINAYAAKCRFVMVLTGVKTEWTVDGTYDANQVFVGNIIQNLPTCTGFLCAYMGQVQWIGRSSRPVKEYYYQWSNGHTAGCEVAKINNVVKGNFYGSY